MGERQSLERILLCLMLQGAFQHGLECGFGLGVLRGSDCASKLFAFQREQFLFQDAEQRAVL